MAMLPSAFDARVHNPSDDYELVPPGHYTVLIEDSEMRVTQNGLGQYLWLKMLITGSDHAGRYLFLNLNLVNANDKAVEIANRDLSAICHAVGKLQVQDSLELHNIHFRVKVTQKKRKDSNDVENVIRGFKAIEVQGGFQHPAQQQQQYAPPPPPPMGANYPPPPPQQQYAPQQLPAPAPPPPPQQQYAPWEAPPPPPSAPAPPSAPPASGHAMQAWMK